MVVCAGVGISVIHAPVIIVDIHVYADSYLPEVAPAHRRPRLLPRAGSSIAASTAIMAITTRSSIRVNAVLAWTTHLFDFCPFGVYDPGRRKQAGDP